MRNKLIVLFIAAFLVRLIAVNQSLWLDEGTTAKVIQMFSLGDIISKFSPADFHPPLYYLLMKLHSMVFGYSELSLRIPSIDFSLLAGWFVYLIGKRIGGLSQKLETKSSHNAEDFGFWAAAFFLFNPLIIYYSQEVRMYMMTTFLLAGACYFFIELSLREAIATKQSQKDRHSRQGGIAMTSSLVWFNLFIFLSFLTFYGSIFMIMAFYLYLIWKKQWQLLFKLVPGFIFALIIVSPLLYRQYLHSREALQIVVNWTQVLGKATFKNLFLIPLKFSIGRISFFPKSLYYALSIPWTLVLLFFTFKNSLKNQMVLFLFVVPLTIGLVFSFLSPLLQYFRFIYLIVFMCVLLALTLKKDWQRYLILSGLLVFSLAYLLFPQFHREDWKSLAQEIPSQNNVYAIPSSMDALHYYRPDIEIHNLLDGKFNGPRILVIPYTAEIYGYDYKKVLQSKGYALTSEKTYREVTLQIWTVVLTANW